MTSILKGMYSMKSKLYLPLIALVLMALACNSFISLPGTSLNTGPSQTFSISEPPSTDASFSQAEFALAPGTGSLVLAGGSDSLVEGQVEYNVTEWKPVLTTANGILRIEQNLPDKNIASVPKDAFNRWELALGDGLTGVKIQFPAGVYVLTLDDSLPNDAKINIQAGATTLRLVVPSSVAASVEVHRGPSGVETEGEWKSSGNTYTTSGSGPAWTIQLEIGVGSLTLVSK